ncbi:MAG TPA: hypothetical protein VMZ71_05215 [Gemmataceae bacterium]|nr:hypothetical protein [Gemmataceae bacterium]
MPTPGSPIAGAFFLDYRDPRSRKRDWAFYFHNGVTTEGVNYLLNAAFRGGSQQPNWFLGLIDDAGFSALAAADTHALHSGWGEYTGIFLSSRPAWNVLTAASGGIVPSSSVSVFQITAAGSVRGALVASQQAVGTGGGAVLYATGAMSAGMSVSVGGVLSVTYAAQLRN